MPVGPRSASTRSTATLCSRISAVSRTSGLPSASQRRMAVPPMFSTSPFASARSEPAAAEASSVSTSWNFTDELPQLRTSTFMYGHSTFRRRNALNRRD